MMRSQFHRNQNIYRFPGTIVLLSDHSDPLLVLLFKLLACLLADLS
jgi:hypothetical protein